MATETTDPYVLGKDLKEGSKIYRDGEIITIVNIRQPSPPAVVVWFRYLQEGSEESVVGYCGTYAVFASVETEQPEVHTQ